MVLLPLTGEILAPATSKTVSQTHFFTPNSCFIFKNLRFHIRLNAATLTGSVAKSFTLNKLSKATIQSIYFIKGQNNGSCPKYFLSRLLYWFFGQISNYFHCCCEVKCTKLYSLFLPFLSSQEDDGFDFLPRHIRKLCPWWGMNPVFIFQL